MTKDLLKYIAVQEDDGVRLDSILKNKLNLSRRIITGMKKNNSIYVNGEAAFTNLKVKKGDEISVNLLKDESQNIEAQNIPIEIVFEDADLLIVNKQPGMVVHPTKGHPIGTLSNGVIYHWRQRNENTIVRLVNRLDRDTSGLVMIAKNQFCHQAMAKQMDNNTVEKIYCTVVHGILDKNDGTIDQPIDRPFYDSIKREVMEKGQRAVTHYKTIEILNDASLLEVRLETGKTHQIRVHLSFLGHPLYGDTLYGEENDDAQYIKRQALHAYKLSFNHPRTGEKMTVTADIPEDINVLIQKLREKHI
ncbi:ribosomal large subunit pseudouridine synthase D [Oxobacter pfennigii]|uniref:Pseudouridine synthase n=1 Tax=Oxobacter pfennigii TaxID=36849 RepID=A0A0P8W875_9CLOT|nr:RluA family pseudouridine synthase [Oxobacter pfennigii]KPU44218.1 ribosomal large subunit pseudouridine synthase D [Oxobacter pfennigii]